MSKIAQIEVVFPVLVELTREDEIALVELISRITDRYKAEYPHRTMWPAGIGCKMLSNPFLTGDDEALVFDENVFAISVSERENYSWPCAKCHHEQGNHAGLILDPPAGDCEYEPAKAGEKS